jgi:hypothetical protein
VNRVETEDLIYDLERDLKSCTVRIKTKGQRWRKQT